MNQTTVATTLSSATSITRTSSTFSTVTMNTTAATSMTQTTSLATHAPWVPVARPTLHDILSMYWEYRTAESLGRYGFPVIVALGTIGNLLTLIVMLKPGMRKTSTYFYMAVMAIFDTLVLYFGCFRQWLAVLDGLDALVLSSTACKTFNFLSYSCFDIAVWVLVAMTTERFIAVHFPLKASKYATISRARIVTILLIALLMAVNIHFFWTVEIDDRGRCNYLEQFGYFHDEVWPWLDATIYSFLPFVLLLVFNSFIIYDNRKSIMIRKSTRNSYRLRNQGQHSGLQFRLSAMLVTVSLVFLLLSAPNVTLISIRHIYFDFSQGVKDIHNVAVYTLLSRVTNFFLYMNHSVNFLLYCVSGQRFRRELVNLLKCKWSIQQARSSVFSDTTRTLRLSESPTASTISDSVYRQAMEHHI